VTCDHYAQAQVCVSWSAATGLARVEATIPRPIPTDAAGLSYPVSFPSATHSNIV
jgi:hypothetical protein